jgi:transposase-like protein
MIVSAMEWQIHEMYYFDISTSAISRSTGKIIGDIIAWRNTPLEKHYLMVWMDGTVKVRENPKIIKKTVYIAIGLRTDSKRKCYG